jgi:PncC family amidohydrolase
MSDLATQIHGHLIARGLTLALAESCTGGALAAAITSVAGASQFFFGSAVVYSSDAKVRLLGVKQELIEREGPVSEPVALAMAQGAQAVFGADVTLGVTGVAGPSGGTERMPVGTICCALVTNALEKNWTLHLKGDREQIVAQAVEELLRALLAV